MARIRQDRRARIPPPGAPNWRGANGKQRLRQDPGVPGVPVPEGRLQQHGASDLRIANLVRDREWLEHARLDAEEVLRGDPDLGRPEHADLAEALRLRFGGARVENARVR